MTPEAQRIAIAEACGWKRCELYRRPPSLDELEPTPFLRGMPPDAHGADPFFRMLPDYLTDLNAMHEAEKALTRGQAIYYVEHLASITGDVGPQSWLYHATAAQRAEAFLRALNLWDDSK